LVKEYVFEQERLDYRAALICSVIAEVNRNRKKRKKPYTPKDFMPKEKRRRMTGEQMAEQLKLINIALGGEAK